jgi:hypothetical protein
MDGLIRWKRGSTEEMTLSARQKKPSSAAIALGVQGCPKRILLNSPNTFEILVSAVRIRTCDPSLKRALERYHAIDVSMIYSTPGAQKDAIGVGVLV